nr:retrovirus-related Pol polyprotein from transposon TNT 1-94 [Tanacetum cinerariifolium]
MLSHANLDKDFWVEAATTVTYLINRSPHRYLDGNIPEILWSGNFVDYSNLRVFGCPVYVHVNEGKLLPRHVKCIFLGYGSGVKGYRVWCPDPKYRKIIHSRDVTFNEDFITSSDLKLEQLDIKTAFLHGHPEEEIYVEQPEGFKVPEKEDHLELKDQLSKEFDMKDLGAAKTILGMEIQRVRKMGKLTLSQTDYISKVLKKFNMRCCKPVPTSLAPHFKLSSHECPKSEEVKEDISRVPYLSAIGSLMYAMVCVRLDLAHVVSIVSRYMHNPDKMHWEAVKCILRYLKVTSNIGLSFEKGRASPNGVVGHVDSDYAGDLGARKSLSSYIFSHYGSVISWYSSFQAIKTLSTTEAEYISSTEGVKEAIWLRGMVNEFGLPQELALLVFDTLWGAATTTMKSYGFWFKVEIVGIVSQKLNFTLVDAPSPLKIGNHECEWPNSGSFYENNDSGGECGVLAETMFYVPAENRAKFWYSTN